MGRVDFNTILIFSDPSPVRSENPPTAHFCRETKSIRLGVDLRQTSQGFRKKFGMCEDRLNPNFFSPGLYPASKGTDDGLVAETENPVFSKPGRLWNKSL